MGFPAQSRPLITGDSAFEDTDLSILHALSLSSAYERKVTYGTLLSFGLVFM